MPPEDPGVGEDVRVHVATLDTAAATELCVRTARRGRRLSGAEVRCAAMDDLGKMRHPVERVPSRLRGRVALVLAALVVAASAWMNAMLPGMDGASTGILSFELARTPERAAEIVDVWRAAGRIDDARLQLWVDYPYMVAYGLLLSLGCIWARDRALVRGRPGLARAGYLLAWGALVAAILDAVENALLFAVLRDPSSGAIGFATAAASAKLVLLVAAMGLIAAAGAGGLRERMGRRPPVA